jgi:pimeloyl-ACP methyl ester carboxylesterase
MKISKWLQIGLVILILSSVLLAGCGVPQSEYEDLQAEHTALVEENTSLKAELAGVQSDLTKLQAEYDKLKGEPVVEYLSVFKSPQAEAAYMAAYDSALEKWPVPYEEKYVPTSYGDTYMIVSGPEDGEPLILIHGAGSNAARWSLNISALAQSYRVYALDLIGWPGRSKPLKPHSDRTDYADWLTEILDALKIEKANMVGYSAGGFFTACCTLEKPERINKVVLLAPAATILPFTKEWHLKSTFTATVAGLAINVYDVRRSLSYALDGTCQMLNIPKEELAEDDEDMAALIPTFGGESLEEYRKRIDSLSKSSITNLFAPGNFREDMYPESFWEVLASIEYGAPVLMFGPYPLTDEDLQKIKTPTLLLIGDHEILYDADQAIKRAEDLVENIQTAIIPNAGHAVVWEQTELVNSHILEFLSGDN